ncbi:ribosomal protein L18 [Halocaridina rubra]|uniref:Large ribosomal subunit protein uL18m n=1 Tax=Halocaridina rubra TaxID=373956 RepID=A0AAN8WY31_HALRR
MFPSVSLFPLIRKHCFASLIVRRGKGNAASSNNDDINPAFVNRNPRNMEMLRIGRKPQGYALDSPNRSYWYKVLFEQSNKNITARVEHHTGTTVVSASTNEWAIKQYLYSRTDTSAAENIGRILAQRCLQSGITEIHSDLKQRTDKSEKVRLFVNALLEGGIRLQEAKYIAPHEMYRWARYLPTLPWHVTEEDVLREDEVLEKNQVKS